MEKRTSASRCGPAVAAAANGVRASTNSEAVRAAAREVDWACLFTGDLPPLSLGLACPDWLCPGSQRNRSKLIAVEAGQDAKLRKLVLAADADRRRIERELHDGVQQHLVALAVNLQLASGSSTPILRRRRRSSTSWDATCRQALDETAQLAQRIYPPLLEAGGLAAALRSAAVSAGIPSSVEVAAGATLPARGRGDGLLVLARGARARATAGRTRQSPSAKTRGRSLRDRRRTATPIRARAAARPRRGARGPADIDQSRDAVPASPARYRSRDDASRSPPGRGSRP